MKERWTVSLKGVQREVAHPCQLLQSTQVSPSYDEEDSGGPPPSFSPWDNPRESRNSPPASNFLPSDRCTQDREYRLNMHHPPGNTPSSQREPWWAAFPHIQPNRKQVAPSRTSLLVAYSQVCIFSAWTASPAALGSSDPGLMRDLSKLLGYFSSWIDTSGKWCSGQLIPGHWGSCLQSGMRNGPEVIMRHHSPGLHR